MLPGNVLSSWFEYSDLCEENCGDIIHPEIGLNSEDTEKIPRRTPANPGKILIGRWSKKSRKSPNCGEPPEVVVLQAPLHARPAKTTAINQEQPTTKRSRPKTSVKPDKKFMKHQFQKQGHEDADIIRDDGRFIASKVLPIMAMLLQKSEDEEEPSVKPSIESPKKCLLPKLSVQCIQLLPSEPMSPRK